VHDGSADSYEMYIFHIIFVTSYKVKRAFTIYN